MGVISQKCRDAQRLARLGKTYEDRVGIERAKEIKEKQSKSGLAYYGEHEHSCKGVPQSDETRALKSKIAKSKGFGKWMTGKKLTPEECSKRCEVVLKGENHPNWKGGITSLTVMIRNMFEAVQWKKEVFKRDGFKCQKCGSSKSGTLRAHHLKPFASIMQEFLKEYYQFSPILDKETLEKLAITYKPFWDVSNGQTLCEECHQLTESFGQRID